MNLKIAKIFSCLKLILLIAILSILSSSLSSASEYRVKSVNELKSALKTVQPGDRIIMINGEWRDAKILFEASGTKEKPIILKAETAGEVILTGSSSLRIAGDYLIADGLYFKDGALEKGSVIEFRKDEDKSSNYSRLTNTVIVDYNPPVKETEYKWVSLYGTHNRVDHCYFRNKVNAGCLLVVWLEDKPNYHLIDSNYFAFRPELGVNGAEIIRVGTSHWSMYPSYTTVENNYFEQCNGEREIISNKSFYNTYRHNTFVECRGALTLRHGNYCTVEGNYFFGNNIKGTGGIRIIGEGHKVINNYIADTEGADAFSAISFMNGVKDSPLNRYFQVKDALVAFNTLINNRTSFEIGVGKNEELSLPPVNSTIANNIVFSTKGKLVTETDTPQNFKWEGNIFYGSEMGMNPNDGVRFIDPKLEKGKDGLWRQTNFSPSRNAAAGKYDLVNVDIDGQIRKEPKDIGSDQISDEKNIYRPLTKKDVGPCWFINNMK
ncbi:MAG: polysaccharide lyase 6 family protein [Melioribacteraceae bacterium]